MAVSRFSLLLVDDDDSMLTMLADAFEDSGYDLVIAPDAERALELAAARPVDAALVDLHLPGMGGLSLLKELKTRWPGVQVCIITGAGAVKDAVTAIQNGAVDFLEKPVALEMLRTRVSRMHEVWSLHRENERLRDEQQFSFGYEKLVGASLAMRELKALITRVAPSDASVLVLGETGSGKEVAARAIHKLSGRADRVFVAVDCASITTSLMESEIFGHVKGAFTGADTAQAGLIRSAEGGTIFFDEIGELPLQVQSKILRVLQEREVRPVGSARSYPVDVRIIAATNRDLAREVREKTFREDLYYRLNGLLVRVPPLRERWEDIPVLARYFLQVLRTAASVPRDISREALENLESYDWPGNVRELENAIRRALVLGQAETIRPEDLPPEITGERGGERGDGGRYGSLASYEAAAIREALARSGGKRKLAARILGIGEATLYRKLKEYSLGGDAGDPPSKPGEPPG